jgi:hypothetical protein
VTHGKNRGSGRSRNGGEGCEEREVRGLRTDEESSHERSGDRPDPTYSHGPAHSGGAQFHGVKFRRKRHDTQLRADAKESGCGRKPIYIRRKSRTESYREHERCSHEIGGADYWVGAEPIAQARCTGTAHDTAEVKDCSRERT